MTARYLVADVFDGLATLDDGSVDLVVTSPPFLALRSYLPSDHPDKSKEIGSEPTPAAFLDVMLRFTAELRRVVAPHGSICIELGDTYAGSGTSGEPLPMYREGFDRGDGRKTMQQQDYGAPTMRNGGGPGWPLAKSKTLIPELYRIALAYGINPLTGEPSPAGQWRIRNVVTWARPNPPVGALGDKWRPATSDVVVACVSSKRYWDDLATRRPVKPHTAKYEGQRGSGPKKGNPDRADAGLIEYGNHPAGAPLLDYWEIPLDGSEPTPYGPKEKPSRIHETNKGVGKQIDGFRGPAEALSSGAGEGLQNQSGAPLLDYWVIPPGGYEGSHYAVFPPELVVPLVKAMTPERVCRECGEPSRRIVEKSERYQKLRDAIGDFNQRENGQGSSGSRSVASDAGGYDLIAAEYETTGWTDCGHNNWRPGVVLDPFAGSGTTLLVATGHGHDAIGIDLDARNAELALQRVGPFLMEVG